MGAQEKTVGGQPNSQLGKDFTSFLGQSMEGVSDFVSQLLSGEGGISQQILQGVGTPGFDLNSEFGQAFTAEQQSRAATDTANINARFGVGGPGGVGGGLGFGTGAARLTSELAGDRARQDALAVGQLNEQALMRDFQALLGLGGLQSGTAGGLIGAANQQTALATPQAQTIQSGGFGDILGAFTGIAGGLSPFAPFLGSLGNIFGNQGGGNTTGSGEGFNIGAGGIFQ